MESLSPETRDIIESVLKNIERWCAVDAGRDGFWLMLRATREEEIRTGHFLRSVDKLPPRDRKAFWVNSLQHVLALLPVARSPRRLLATCEHDISACIERTCDIHGMNMDGSCPAGRHTVSRGFSLSW